MLIGLEGMEGCRWFFRTNYSSLLDTVSPALDENYFRSRNTCLQTITRDVTVVR